MLDVEQKGIRHFFILEKKNKSIEAQLKKKKERKKEREARSSSPPSSSCSLLVLCCGDGGSGSGNRRSLFDADRLQVTLLLVDVAVRYATLMPTAVDEIGYCAAAAAVVVSVRRHFLLLAKLLLFTVALLSVRSFLRRSVGRSSSLLFTLFLCFFLFLKKTKIN